jgi:hypothetical protein
MTLLLDAVPASLDDETISTVPPGTCRPDSCEEFR